MKSFGWFLFGAAIGWVACMQWLMFKGLLL